MKSYRLHQKNLRLVRQRKAGGAGLTSFLVQGLVGVGWKAAEELGGFCFGFFGDTVNIGDVAFNGFLGEDALKG
jgi:hypothetical protein